MLTTVLKVPEGPPQASIAGAPEAKHQKSEASSEVNCRQIHPAPVLLFEVKHTELALRVMY